MTLCLKNNSNNDVNARSYAPNQAKDCLHSLNFDVFPTVPTRRTGPIWLQQFLLVSFSPWLIMFEMMPSIMLKSRWRTNVLFYQGDQAPWFTVKTHQDFGSIDHNSLDMIAIMWLESDSPNKQFTYSFMFFLYFAHLFSEFWVPNSHSVCLVDIVISTYVYLYKIAKA